MRCIVIEPIHIAGHRKEPGAEVELDPRMYERLRSAGCVQLVEVQQALAEAQAEADRFREGALAEAEAEHQRLMSEAEAKAEAARLAVESGAPAPGAEEPDEGAADPEPAEAQAEADGLEGLDDEALKALVRDEALEGVDLRYRGDRLRDQIRAARAAKAEPEPLEGAALEA